MTPGTFVFKLFLAQTRDSLVAAREALYNEDYETAEIILDKLIADMQTGIDYKP